MRNRAIAFLAVASLTSLPLLAQVGETIEVRVANVDVVVTDRSGAPVHGLTRDDFELYENGKLQPITNFSEIRDERAPIVAESATAAVAPSSSEAVRRDAPRNVVIFIDNSSIEPFRRNQVIDSVEKAFSRIVRPGDEAMVVTWNNHFETMQRFTSDAAAIKRELENARSYGASASALPVVKQNVLTEARANYASARERRMRWSDAYSASVGAARGYAESVRHTQLMLIRSVTQTSTMLSGAEGKKILIFVGGELEQRPGLDVFQQVDTLFANVSKNAMPAMLRENDLSTTEEILKLARNANANGVTLYMIDALDRSRGAAESGPMDPEVAFTNDTNSYFSMLSLANNTGGAILSGANNFDSILSTISRDLDSYYSLGYKPQTNGDRSILVKVKKSGLVVRSRRTLNVKTAEEQTGDRVVASAFHSSMNGDFPVQVTTEKPEPFQKGLFKVKMTVTFPSTLTYLPDGDNVAAEFTAYFVTASREGNMSPVAKQTQPVKFPASAREQVTQKPFTLTSAIVVKPGVQTISVAVLDRYGARTGYARTTINAQ